LRAWTRLALYWKERYAIAFAFTPMNLRQTILVLGDIALLYLSLVGALLISGETQRGISEHVPAFTALFMVWIGVFYAAGCYDLQRLKNSIAFSQLFAYTLLANALLSILF